MKAALTLERFTGREKSRAMCIADTFARRIGVLTDPAALARILYDYDKMMNVSGDRLVKHSEKLCV